MSLEKVVMGVNKANFDELKELKVRLPIRVLVNLQYLKLTEGRATSDIVNQALNEFFAMRSARLRSRSAEDHGETEHVGLTAPLSQGA